MNVRTNDLCIQQIFGLTPRSHADHLSMFSLLHCTEMMIRVLQSVKSREQEYGAMKVLATRIQGVPLEFQLARRERRLVAQGPLLRLYLNNYPDSGAPDYAPNPSAPGLSEQTPSSIKSQSGPSRPHNRLLSPSIHHPSTKSQLELHPLTETSTAPESIYTAAEFSSDPASYDFPLGRDSEASDVPGSLPYRMLPYGDPQPNEPSKWIYAFVFTDIVVLAKHRHQVSIRGVTNDSWELLPDVGIARVLGYSDMSSSQRELDLPPAKQQPSL